MFFKAGAEGFSTVLPGIRLKTLSIGDAMLLAEFRMDQGSKLPLHAHPQEQVGRLLQGSIRLSIGGDSRVLSPGDGWCVPGGVEHGAEILAESVAIEVFSPVREDYRAYYGGGD